MDYALLCVGSSFTVGVAEEEHNTASVTEMADALFVAFGLRKPPQNCPR